MACSPNTEPGTDTLAIFSPSLMTSTAPLLRKNSLPVFEPAASTTWLAGCFTIGNPASLLSKAAASGMIEGILASFFSMETNYLMPGLQDRVGPKSNCAMRYSGPNLSTNRQRTQNAIAKEDGHESFSQGFICAHYCDRRWWYPFDANPC